MSKSCSIQITPNGAQQPPPIEQSILQTQAASCYSVRNKRRNARYYGCCPAQVILGVFILIHTSIIVIWMIREYFFFDFKCAVMKTKDGENPENEVPTGLEEGRKPYENERKGINFGWRNNDRIVQITDRRVGESARFPRYSRVVFPEFSNNSPITNTNQFFQYVESSGVSDPVRIPRFPRSYRSFSPISSLLYFPPPFTSSTFLNPEESELQVNVDNRLERVRSCLYLPGCPKLGAVQEGSLQIFQKFNLDRRKYLLIHRKTIPNELSADSRTTAVEDKANSDYKGRRRRSIPEDSGKFNEFQRKTTRRKTVLSKNRQEVAKKTDGFVQTGQKYRRVITKHHLKGQKVGNLTRRVSGYRKSSTPYRHAIRKFPSKIGTTNKERKKMMASSLNLNSSLNSSSNSNSIPRYNKMRRKMTGGVRSKLPVSRKALGQSGIGDDGRNASKIRLLSKNLKSRKINVTRPIRHRNQTAVAARSGRRRYGVRTKKLIKKPEVLSLSKSRTIQRSGAPLKNLSLNQKPEILAGNSQSLSENQKILKWSGESWEADQPKPTQKRYHFLSGGSAFPRIQQNSSAPRTSWIDGVIDPQDENFSNKGQIRFYPGKVAHKLSKKRRKNSHKQPKQISPRHSEERPAVAEEGFSDKPEITENRDGEKPEQEGLPKRTKSDGEDREFGKKQQRKWKSAEDAQRRPSHPKDSKVAVEEELSESESNVVSTSMVPTTAAPNSFMVTTNPVVIDNPVRPVPRTQEFSVVKEPVDQYRIIADIDQPHHPSKFRTNPTSTATSVTRTLAFNEMRHGEANAFVRGPKYYMLTTTSTMEPSSTIETEEIRARKREIFLTQLSAFTNSALCIARTLLALWCMAEFLATIPFLIGIWCPSRCLFVGHIILDTLFLVLGFIYSVTIAVYSVILYILVADMSLYTLLQWLSFAITIDLVLIIYLILFVITVRCCDLVIDDELASKRNRNATNQISNSTDNNNINIHSTSYQEIGHPDGNLL